jgi:hypothetical protein
VTFLVARCRLLRSRREVRALLDFHAFLLRGSETLAAPGKSSSSSR